MASILKVRDNSGKVIEIPVIRGPAGKSVYEYAKECGWNGTEKEFAAVFLDALKPPRLVTHKVTMNLREFKEHRVLQLAGTGMIRFLSNSHSTAINTVNTLIKIDEKEKIVEPAPISGRPYLYCDLDGNLKYGTKDDLILSLPIRFQTSVEVYLQNKNTYYEDGIEHMIELVYDVYEPWSDA